MDLCQVCDQELESFQIETVQKELKTRLRVTRCFVRLSYPFAVHLDVKVSIRSCADRILFSAYKWTISRLSLVSDVSCFHLLFSFDASHSSRTRMCLTGPPVTSIRMRCNCGGATSSPMISNLILESISWIMCIKLRSFSNDRVMSLHVSDSSCVYPLPTGVIIGMDLAYNLWSAYGNWFPGMKLLMQ